MLTTQVKSSSQRRKTSHESLSGRAEFSERDSMLSNKHILLGAGTVAAIYGATYLLKLNRLSAELETVTKISIHKVSLKGIDIKINVTLKNPSGGSIKVKHPFVKLIYADRTIATSQIKDVNIAIPKYSEVNLEPVMVNLGFLNLAMNVPGLLKEYNRQAQFYGKNYYYHQ